MISNFDFLISGFFPWVLSTIGFLTFMYYLKKKNFNKNGKRIDKWRKLTPELLSQQIEYHNKATYTALEFYLKCLLAIIGGIAFIATHQVENKQNNIILFQTAGGLIVLTTLLFCILIIVHQKSKIIRWEKGFNWYDPLLWNECWFVSISITIAWFVNRVIIPLLIEHIR